MSDRTTVSYIFPLDADAPYVGASMFLAALAYPDVRDSQRRAEFGTALQIDAVRRRYKLDPAWAERPQQLHPLLVATDHEKCKKYLAKGRKLLMQRVICAHFILRPALADHFSDHEIRAFGFKFSVNAMVTQAAHFLGRQSDSTLKTKIWRPSWPVIHATSAFLEWHSNQENYADQSAQSKLFVQFFFSRDELAEVIEISATHRKMVRQISKFKLAKDQLIRFRAEKRSSN